MKKFILFARVYTWLLIILPVICSAQNLDVYPNYVVIGAFEHKKNAVFFTDDANQHNFPARFEMNPRRNLYYVYVLTTDDREYAFAEALKLRTDTKYFDTWVFAGLLGEAALANASKLDRDFNPATGEQILSVESEQATKTSGATSANPQNSGSTLATEDLSVNNDDGNAQTRSEARDNQDVALNGIEKDTNKKGRANRKSKGDQTSVPALTPESGDNVDLSANSDEANAQSSSKENQDVDGLQKAVSGERTAAGTNRGQDPKLNQSANNANERGQVTITKADGTTVIADTRNGSTVTNDPTRRSANSADQSKSEATSPTDGKAKGGTSNDRLTTSNTETVAGTNVKNSGTSNNAQNTSGQNESSLETKNQLAATHVDLGPPPKQVSTEPLSKEEVTGKNFYFYVFRADNHDMVGGEVDAIDFEKARRMATYPANAPVKIIMPSGKSKQISFLCQVFGYRKLQKEFDPASPAEDMYLDDRGNVVVPFDLMRLQKGDIAIMYNVFFFKDAAVMRPESRYEVNNLLELLQENPTYKIKIHGHTNGNAAGKIIYMDKPGNFYSLSNTKQGGGSAKKLSEERALLIREYLISSGISADRMQVEAWGGKKPIHDKHSARAHENVRVEIEILSD